MKKVLLLAAIAALAIPASAAKKAMKTKEPAKFTNGVLTNNKGMTLYTFDMDKQNSGKSACNGPCLSIWKPLKASKKAAAMGDYSVVTRDDGAKQWAYKGWPLYTWTKDKKPGDMTGDNFKNVWHVIKPEAPAAAPAAAPAQQ